MGIHLNIEADDKKVLKAYSKARGTTMTGTLKDAFGVLKNLDPIPAQTKLLNTIFEGKYKIPLGMLSRGFIDTLVLLGNNYPDNSSRDFWGSEIYLSLEDKTHGEVLIETMDELEALIEEPKE